MHSLPTPYEDDRGIIQPLLHQHNGSIVVITSKAGAERGSHYHKEDYHYCYIVEGMIEYFERPAKSSVIPVKMLYKQGEIFYTPPMIEHTMYFPVKTVFITMGGGTRLSETYEEDLVRVASLYRIHLQKGE